MVLPEPIAEIEVRGLICKSYKLRTDKQIAQTESVRKPIRIYASAGDNSIGPIAARVRSHFPEVLCARLEDLCQTDHGPIRGLSARGFVNTLCPLIDAVATAERRMD